MLVSGFALSALSLFAFNSPSFAQAPASKPNILFIMGDGGDESVRIRAGISWKAQHPLYHGR
jgi:hypothetical protein